MPSPIQTSFEAGETSPRMGGRFDSERYAKSLKLCENFEPKPQGSLLMRAGSEHSRPLLGDNRTRLVQFRMVNGQDYLLELYDHVMRIYLLDGSNATPQIVTISEMIENGDFALGGTGWQGQVGGYTAWGNLSYNSFGTIYEVQFTAGRVNFKRPGASFSEPLPQIYQKVTLLSPSSIDLSWKSGQDGGDINGIIVKVGTTLGGNDLYNYNGATGDGAVTFNAPAGDCYIFFSSVGDGTINSSSIWVDDVSFKATATGPQDHIVTPWSADELIDLRLTSETGLDRAIFTHPAHVPYFLKFNGGSLWDFRAIVFTSQPGEWGGATWPGLCEFSKGRAWYSGLATAKNRVWGSVVNDPFKLTLGTALPAEAMDLKMATNGAVQWMKDSAVLLIGTDIGEHSLTGGSTPVPLNGDFDARKETYYGSSNIQAISAGDTPVFVSGDKLRLRAIEFAQQANKWKSVDLLFFAEHLTLGDAVKEVHHAITPDGALIVVMASGKLLAATFEPSAGVVAWWRAPLSSGLVRSGAVSRGPLGAFLWLAVERGGAMWLERLPLSEGNVARSYVDAAVTGVVDGAGACAGLAHLNGLVARVIVAGSVAGDFPVAGGAVQLPDADDAGKAFTAGLAYRAKAITQPKNTKYGLVRSSAVGVILNNSALPLVNGRRAPERTPATPMDSAEPRVTGKRTQAGKRGWTEDGTVTIEQDLPFRTEILAIYEATEVNQVQV